MQLKRADSEAANGSGEHAEDDENDHVLEN
jgi:hypothetical protein